MQQILDLHIHSKYSRACSRDLTLENIDKTCRIKGVDIIATGDFTHPAWFERIKEDLTPLLRPAKRGYGGQASPSPKQGEGSSTLYTLKSAADDKIKFILSTEVALIYKSGDRCRRIHIVIHAPNIKAVAELIVNLEKRGVNLKSDGRPIFGLNAPDLAKLCLSIHPQFLIYPAHIWTPWFSVFGSKSGFNSLEECFAEWTPNIYAYETGLSSDPEMNWRLSALDNLTLISNSDAHSLQNIGREANVYELEEMTYDEIYAAIKEKDAKKIKQTIEFYPEEGMYHYDGHRACGVSFAPAETRRNKGICPACKKPLVIGVMNRVEELADRPAGYHNDRFSGFAKLVGLDKIIAETENIASRNSKKVQAEYRQLIQSLGSELHILLNADLENIRDIVGARVAEGVSRVRAGRLIIKPGFDGQYGEVKIFGEEEKEAQKKLF